MAPTSEEYRRNKLAPYVRMEELLAEMQRLIDDIKKEVIK